MRASIRRTLVAVLTLLAISFSMLASAHDAVVTDTDDPGKDLVRIRYGHAEWHDGSELEVRSRPDQSSFQDASCRVVARHFRKRGGRFPNFL